MPHQLAITIGARIEDGRRDDVVRALEDMHQQGVAHNDVLPFAELSGVHFARLFVLDSIEDLDGEPIPATLYYLVDVDAPSHRHLRELAERSGIDAVFGNCQGFPSGGSPRARLAWLRAHQTPAAATYTHTMGRSVSQVRDEARLRAALDESLDQGDVVAATDDPVTAYRKVRQRIDATPGVRWARRPAARPGLFFRARTAVSLVAVPVVALMLLPVLVPAAAIVLVLIRLRERHDVAESTVPDLDHVREVEKYEDFVAQNPFTAVGFVKPGMVRRLTMRTVLFGLDWTNQHFFARDNLAGVRTIHFARWVPIDGGRRLIFASNYDGSLESYMDDFIDRLAWGLNAVFSNGVGYPSTKWLIFGGARDETAFKHYLRNHQVPTVVWYSAYDRLPARNVDSNQHVRQGIVTDLSGDDAAAAAWLARL
jgi:hypothetical protein